MYLALRSDSDTTELYLLDERGKELRKKEWLSQRRLADELLGELKGLLEQASHDWGDLSGLIVFLGPGSFTGLRIGMTVMNTIAFERHIPIVGAKGDRWLEQGVARLESGDNDTQCVPFYGAEPNITKPKR